MSIGLQLSRQLNDIRLELRQINSFLTVILHRNPRYRPLIPAKRLRYQNRARNAERWISASVNNTLRAIRANAPRNVLR